MNHPVPTQCRFRKECRPCQHQRRKARAVALVGAHGAHLPNQELFKLARQVKERQVKAEVGGEVVEQHNA